MASVVLSTGCIQCTSDSCYFFGFFGVAASIMFSNLGAAYGTGRGSVGLCSMGVMHPEMAMRNMLGIIMATVLGIYGLIISIVLSGQISDTTYCEYKAYAHLASGLSVGISCLGAGFAIGIASDVGVRAVGQQPRLYVAMVLILIFAEALALYGMIIAIVLSQK
mmetsp:Transcript_33095/g.29004  ORF Transcript_33095/g.29004 Transcript_33095/m.29004 type:complete len:164 (-) Transcript_33095:193-684(-)|eukprot:CAMPEP_0201577484 /NCGR_PEP_ID=MMETSP0190_2-20130828/23901_1 /ASSEMBLY_ACC=CAM_ASM_000263 /TAXON_ID=37353 /ORGANISM="Rosalina sp." /LENGTH=163 /DNA_ID=CAMNT_0048009579 /DNA_START=38 /DNA_END=529 /DNA_ORIENTATION=+